MNAISDAVSGHLNEISGDLKDDDQTECVISSAGHTPVPVVRFNVQSNKGGPQGKTVSFQLGIGGDSDLQSNSLTTSYHNQNTSSSGAQNVKSFRLVIAFVFGCPFSFISA